MKLFTSSQDTSSNVMQNAGVELSEQELSAVSGGCGGGCGHRERHFRRDAGYHFLLGVGNALERRSLYLQGNRILCRER